MLRSALLYVWRLPPGVWGGPNTAWTCCCCCGRFLKGCAGCLDVRGCPGHPLGAVDPKRMLSTHSVSAASLDVGCTVFQPPTGLLSQDELCSASCSWPSRCSETSWPAAARASVVRSRSTATAVPSGRSACRCAVDRQHQAWPGVPLSLLRPNVSSSRAAACSCNWRPPLSRVGCSPTRSCTGRSQVGRTRCTCGRRRRSCRPAGRWWRRQR